MEDGIERNFYSLFDKRPTEEKYLYVCIPTETITIGNLIITFERQKAKQIMKEKKCTVEIFKKNSQDLYVSSNDCL